MKKKTLEQYWNYIVSPCNGVYCKNCKKLDACVMIKIYGIELKKFNSLNAEDMNNLKRCYLRYLVE